MRLRSALFVVCLAACFHSLHAADGVAPAIPVTIPIDAFVDERLLFEVQRDRDPGACYRFERTSAKAELLFANMIRIEPEHMAERKPATFNARDGLAITGYRLADRITLPVLLVHGGKDKTTNLDHQRLEAFLSRHIGPNQAAPIS
jgi:dipeptidyl aminopeptidase/acylaminoacyl peptidase